MVIQPGIADQAAGWNFDERCLHSIVFACRMGPHMVQEVCRALSRGPSLVASLSVAGLLLSLHVACPGPVLTEAAPGGKGQDRGHQEPVERVGGLLARRVPE